MAKPPPKNEEGWGSNLFSKILGPSVPRQAPVSQSSASKVPEGSSASAPDASQLSASQLKSIRTPHERTPSHSHPGGSLQ